MRIDIPQQVNAQYAVDTSDPNKGMKQSIQALGAVSEVYDAYESSVATSQLAKHQQELGAVENELTSSDRIDISNPVIPDAVRQKVMASPEYQSDRVTRTQDGRTFIPTQMIMRDTMTEYRNKAYENADNKLGFGIRDRYKAAIDQDFAKADERVQKAEHGYVAQEVQNNYLQAANDFTKSGDYDKFKATIYEAQGVGVLDPTAAQAQIDTGNKAFAMRTEAQLTVIGNNMSQAYLTGNQAAADDYVAQYDQRVNDGVAAGYITPEKGNELSMTARTKGQIQLLSGNMTRIYMDQGIDAAIGFGLGAKTNIPPGVDPEKFQSAVGGEMAQLQQLHNMTTGGKEEAKKAAKLHDSQLAGQLLYEHQAVVTPGTPQAKQVEDFMDKSFSQIDIGRPEGRTAAFSMATEVSANTSYLSDPVIKFIQNISTYAKTGAGTSDPDAAAAAEQVGNFINELQASGGTASQVNSLLAQDPYLAAISTLTSIGTPIEMLNRTATDMANTPASIKKEREKDIDSSKGKDSEWNTTIKNNVGDDIKKYISDRGPASYAAMIVDFNDVYSAIYVGSGDASIAAKAAGAYVRRNWGITDHNGDKRLEKGGMNAVVKVNGSTDWAKPQFEEAKQRMVPPDQLAAIGSENLTWMPDKRSQNGKGLVLKQAVHTGMGVEYYTVTDSEGSVMRFIPDPSQSPEVIQAKKAADDALKTERQTSDYQANLKGKMLQAIKPSIDALSKGTGNPKAAYVWAMDEVDRMVNEELDLLPRTVKGSRGTMVADSKEAKKVKDVADIIKTNIRKDFEAKGGDTDEHKRVRTRFGINEMPPAKPEPVNPDNRGGGRYPNAPSDKPAGRGYSPL